MQYFLLMDEACPKLCNTHPGEACNIASILQQGEMSVTTLRENDLGFVIFVFTVKNT